MFFGPLHFKFSRGGREGMYLLRICVWAHSSSLPRSACSLQLLLSLLSLPPSLTVVQLASMLCSGEEQVEQGLTVREEGAYRLYILI